MFLTPKLRHLFLSAPTMAQQSLDAKEVKRSVPSPFRGGGGGGRERERENERERERNRERDAAPSKRAPVLEALR